MHWTYQWRPVGHLGLVLPLAGAPRVQVQGRTALTRPYLVYREGGSGSPPSDEELRTACACVFLLLVFMYIKEQIARDYYHWRRITAARALCVLITFSDFKDFFNVVHY